MDFSSKLKEKEKIVVKENNTHTFFSEVEKKTFFELCVCRV